MSSPVTYNFDGVDFPIVITMSSAYKLEADYNICLLQLFENNNLDRVVQELSVNDKVALDLWWEFVSTKFQDRSECIDKLTRDSLTKFKEAFWAAIVNFSDPNVKPILLELKKRLPGLLKKSVLNNLNQLESNQQNESSDSTS